MALCFSWTGDHRYIHVLTHSFPTRRSSDLGRDVEVRSCPRSTGDGWSIRIASGDWESGAPIAVAPGTHPFGTEIRVPIDEQWPKSLETVAQRAARYCPLPVQLNGQDLPREDWLKGAETIVEQDGVRIGIYRNYLRSEEHTSELQSLMRISYAVFCLKKKKTSKKK